MSTRRVHVLLRPAAGIADRLSVAGKLLLVAAVLVLPSGLILSSYLSSQGAQMAVA
ncbi:MAG: hypothetical protein QOC73_2378, partial [Actinomycetota bacterium]|nr:hypothetical protein [Actinomycetota bacterium]